MLPVCLHTGLLKQPCKALRSYATRPRPPLSKGQHPNVSPGRLADQQLLLATATCHLQQAAPSHSHRPLGPSNQPRAQLTVCLPEQGLRPGSALASSSKWPLWPSVPSTPYVKGESCPPGKPPERQGTTLLTVAVDVCRGEPYSLNKEARKRRFYSEACLWDLGWEEV